MWLANVPPMASPGERPALPSGLYLVVGLARSGQAAAALLAGRGEKVVGIDSGSPEGSERLRDAGVEVHLDGDWDDLVDGASCVVKSPGVPREAPAVRRALSVGIPVIGELELAWRLLPNPFVAVTGTNGKTTVVELLGHIWRTADQPCEVAGNVGTPLTSLPGTVDAGATVICEASSFQLEDSSAFRPECALLLNVTPDHIDRHGTFEHYLASKLAVFACQGPADFAVVDRSDPVVAPLTLPGRGTEVDVDSEQLPFEPAGDWMIGPHNRRNARFAAVASLRMGIDPAAVARGIESFRGIPHRLEHVTRIGGVDFVNDSKATNVAAAEAGIASFDGKVRAIMGGSLKGGDFSGLAGPVAANCSAVYLTGPAAEPIAAALQAANVPVAIFGDLADAVGQAASEATQGETVLLSPACASFDAYRDYAARGDHFKELVLALEGAI